MLFHHPTPARCPTPLPNAARTHTPTHTHPPTHPHNHTPTHPNTPPPPPPPPRPPAAPPCSALGCWLETSMPRNTGPGQRPGLLSLRRLASSVPPLHRHSPTRAPAAFPAVGMEHLAATCTPQIPHKPGMLTAPGGGKAGRHGEMRARPRGTRGGRTLEGREGGRDGGTERGREWGTEGKTERRRDGGAGGREQGSEGLRQGGKAVSGLQQQQGRPSPTPPRAGGKKASAQRGQRAGPTAAAWAGGALIPRGTGHVRQGERPRLGWPSGFHPHGLPTSHPQAEPCNAARGGQPRPHRSHTQDD